MTYQKLFNKTKLIINENACMKFYDGTKSLYLERDASGVGLRADLLQTISGTSCPRDTTSGNSILRPITFVNKNLSSTEKKIQQHRKGGTRYTA